MEINIISSRLSACMRQQNITAVALAEMSGVTAASISRYLHNLRIPTIDNLISIANALNVSVDYLLGIHCISESKNLISNFSSASEDDRTVIWTILARYNQNNVSKS